MAAHSAILLPEIRLSIACHIPTTADLARFLRTDRLSHELLNSVLYRNIDVLLRAIPLIARTLRSRPSIAAQCVSLRVTSPDYEDIMVEEGQDASKIYQAKCNDLAFVLEELNKHGRFLRFVWDRETMCFGKDLNGAPPSLWAALERSAPLLQDLDVSFSRSDGYGWAAVASQNYVRLQTLRIRLSHACEWENDKLHRMIKALPCLNDLTLRLPICDDPVKLSLSSTHPGLYRFSLQSGPLLQSVSDDENLSKGFLGRHPSLQSLELDSKTDFDIGASDLPHLRMLSLSHITLRYVPGLLPIMSHRAITSLRLVTMPHLTVNTVFDLCHTVHTTLRFLYLDNTIHGFRENLDRLPGLLARLPQLVELRLVAESRSKFTLPHRLTGEHLCRTLRLLSQQCTPKLKAISFSDSRGNALRSSTLCELVSPALSLQYLAWDVQGIRHLYRLDRRGNKTVAVLISACDISWRTWTEEAILDSLH